MPVDTHGPAQRPTSRQHLGRCNNLAGTAAEAAVERVYHDAGMRLVARRWRTKGGEVDLIFCSPDGTRVFVEVKKSHSFDAALRRISPHQIRRIHAAASEFLDTCPNKSLTKTRFDAALVDRHGAVLVYENALLGY